MLYNITDMLRNSSTANPGAAGALFGEFSVSLRLTSLEVIALPLMELHRIDWLDVAPIRHPAFHPDQKRNPGWIYSHKVGGLLPFESRLEFIHLLVADLLPDLAGMLTRPFRLHWNQEGKNASHVPDALLLFSDGSRELLNVTVPERRTRPDVGLRLEAARVAALRLGWRPRVAVGPPPPVLVENVRLLAGCRFAPTGAAALAPAVKQAADGTATITQIEAALGEPVLIRPVILHMLAVGELEFDLEQPLRLSTIVKRRDR